MDSTWARFLYSIFAVIPLNVNRREWVQELSVFLLPLTVTVMAETVLKEGGGTVDGQYLGTLLIFDICSNTFKFSSQGVG